MMSTNFNFLLMATLVAFGSSAFVPSISKRSRVASPAFVTAPSIVEPEKTIEIQRTIGNPSVLERIQIAKKSKSLNNDQRKNEFWELRIYNDDINTREHVTRSLVEVTGMAEVKAYNAMKVAQVNGFAAVGQWAFEVAELYHDAIGDNGIQSEIMPVEEDWQ